ncbi:hypothetical protein O7599_29710 [Streptomyces sp. WMMC500]|uniref:glycoside hydrolase family 38 N-terminal domain-containing protein n=1 Tax=Streptomyces sp. WMMC500 TaxID=3015154 RepID=UPI00248B245B|nr:hypothetical protein [Streptomyces sp. WMMC500]WBB59694.1 hypothetical protein O7599_29710 [Streptomyces sp. WMMC500]
MTTGSRHIEEILVLHHSHLDIGYTHSQPVLWRLQNEFIDQALDWLEETADRPEDARPTWVCEATEPVLRWMKEASPRQIARFRALCEQDRIGLAALRWHVSALVDARGIQRLLDGKSRLEDVVGKPVRIACQHDVNGVPWPLADALLDADVDLFVMAVNGHLGGPVRPRPGLFRWEAPSGRALRVFNGNHYTMFDQIFHAWDDSVGRMQEGWQEYEQQLRQIGYALPFLYLTSTCSPIMWDNAPPNPYMPDLIQRWNDRQAGPVIRYATFDDLRERVLKVPEEDIPLLRGDWTDYWSFGYGSTPVATALNQRSKPLLVTAEALGADAHTVREAADHVDTFDEHTWSYWNTDPANLQAQSIEAIKQTAAHLGHELASLAVMDSLEQLAGNPPADKGIKGVLVCNPTPYRIETALDLPAAWFDDTTPATERTYRASRMIHENRPWRTPSPDEERRFIGTVALEPRSWRIISSAELPAPGSLGQPTHEIIEETGSARELNFAAATSRTTTTGRIDSPFHTLTYAPDSGRITSLVDRRTGREILCPRPGTDLLSPIRERPDPLIDGTRRAYYQRNLDKEKIDESCWQDWARTFDHATRVTACAVREQPGRLRFERRLQAPGLSHLVQRLTFNAADPVIGVETEIEFAGDASPAGVYLALPLAMDGGWRAAFDTAGRRVELDADQLPGASRGWVTTESTATMWDEHGAVALLTPDVPLVQFGEFSFGPPPGAVPRPGNPLLLSWVSNNYWDTNYPQVQRGRITLRHGLLSLATPDFAAIDEQSAKIRNPVLTWPVTTGGRRPSAGTL